MSLNKFSNLEIGKLVGLKIGCAEMDCGTMVANNIVIPEGGDLVAHDIKALNKLETETTSKDGVLNYSTPNLGQPNFSLHTDGLGGTFWSPDDTGNGDISYDGSLPVVVGTHTFFSSNDGVRVGKSKIIEDATDLNMGALTLSNTGTINGIDLEVLQTDLATNTSDITDLDTNKLNIDGTQPMTGDLDMNLNNVNNINVGTLQQQIGTPSNPSATKMKLYFKSDGLLYSLDSDGIEIEVGGKNTEGSKWNFLTILTDTITSGNFNFDNANPVFTTTIRISVDNYDGVSRIPFLRLVKIGNSIVLKNADESNIKVYKVNGAIDETAVRFAYTVILTEQTTTATFSNNEKIRILLDQSTNPFDQSLNTTDDVNFNNLTVTGIITTPNIPSVETAIGDCVQKSTGDLQIIDGNLSIKKSQPKAILSSTDNSVGRLVYEDQDTFEKWKLEFEPTTVRVRDESNNTLFQLTDTPSCLIGSNLTVTGTITTPNISDIEGSIQHLNEQAASGVLNGGFLSINADTTKFDISDGEGYISDAVGGLIEIMWSGLTAQTPTAPYTGILTYVFINSSGLSFTQSSKPTNSQIRDNIFLGVLVHTNFTNLNTVNNEQSVVAYGANQLRDFMNAVGFLNINGNLLSSPSGLFISKSSGTIFAQGSNYVNNLKDPHTLTLPLIDTSSGGIFQYRFQDGSSSALTLTTFNPSLLDDGTPYPGSGTVPGNRYAAHRVYSFISNALKIQPAQFVYNTLSLAKTSIVSEAYNAEPSLVENGLLIGYIIAKGGITDLTVAADCEFISAGKFGTSASVVAGSVSTLQDVYNNSTSPEIITTGGRALTIKEGVDDTNNVFESKNLAGTTKVSITGGGSINVEDGGMLIYQTGLDGPAPTREGCLHIVCSNDIEGPLIVEERSGSGGRARIQLRPIINSTQGGITMYGIVTDTRCDMFKYDITGATQLGRLQINLLNANVEENQIDITLTSTTIKKDLVVSSTTASTTTATGALRVAGGVGIAGNLNIGGDLNGLTPIGGKFSQYGKTTLTNTTTETSIIAVGEGSLVFGANTLVRGHSFKVRCGGNVTTNNGTTTLTVRFKLNAATFHTLTMTDVKSNADGVFTINLYTTFTATGASGSMKFNGSLNIGDGNTIYHPIIQVSPFVINTTIDQTLDITAQWIAASASYILENEMTVVNKIY
jgi:hypothetical protein